MILFRAKTVADKKWVYGSYHYSKKKTKHYILNLEKFLDRPNNEVSLYKNECHEVIQETVCQLRYDDGKRKYFDNDIYYHAGYGNAKVSELCMIHSSLLDGTSEDIERVVGNIFDNPELL